jgi:uncharacterized protein (TIGR03437 family)
VVPYEVNGKASTQMLVTYQGQTSSVVNLAVAQSAPGIFSSNGSGTGPGAILNQDGSPNSAANPAPSGSIIVLYATGEGQTNPTGVNGKLGTTPAPVPISPVTATVGGLPATIIYAGGVAGLVAGVMQVNLQLPTAVVPGNGVPIVLSVGGTASQAGLSVAIR